MNHLEFTSKHQFVKSKNMPDNEIMNSEAGKAVDSASCSEMHILFVKTIDP